MEAFDPRMGSVIVAEELELLKGRIIANMYAQNAVASGRTIRSLKVVLEEYGAALVSEQQMPFGVLETGRRGGAIPYGFAGIIYQWMQDKGVHGEMERPFRVYLKSANMYVERTRHFKTQEQADRSMAGAIAHTIAKSGSSLYRKGGRDTIYSQEIPKTIERIEAKLSTFVEAVVMEQIKLNKTGGQ